MGEAKREPAIIPSRPMRILAAAGALGCGLAVALGAYAMHAALAPRDHERLAVAALFLFAHGLALAALAPAARSRLQASSMGVLLAGALLFAGSLVLAALAGFEPRLAPFGGSLLMLGWLLAALGFVFEWRDHPRGG